MYGNELAGAQSGEHGKPTDSGGRGFSKEDGDSQPPGPFRLKENKGELAVKPRGQVRQGRVFTTEVRALPRPGRPAVEEQELEASFAAQLEEVLAKEEFPLHFKEYVRRYFLMLSRGVSREQTDTEGNTP